MHHKLEVDPQARGLIFDIDGTICDTMPVHYIAWRDTAKEYGIDFTIPLFESVTGMPALETCRFLKEKFHKDFDPEAFTRIKELRYEENIHKVKPIEPVVELIHEYHGKLPMACGTGGYKRLAWKALEMAGVEACFEHVVSAEDVKKHKPDPETFLTAASLIHVEPAGCQVFEDGKLGLQAAEAAGMIATDVTKFYEVTIGREV